MIEALVRWYRSQQLRWLLMRGNRRDAAKQFKKIRGSKTSLSWWERLFEDWLTLQQQSLDSQQQLTALRRQVRQLQQAQRNTLVPDAEISRFVTDAFALQDIDTGMIQCTGIDREVFEQLERQLADYLTSEFERYRTNGLEDKLEEAIEDLEGLKKGIDPSYSSVLSPQIYFLKYFLENVYSLYLAWFFVYKNQHLPTDFKLLDIAAGPGTTLFGLSLLLQRLTRSSGSTPPPVRISYASLEKQEMLQYRGLQFWRRYLKSIESPINAFLQFNTVDLFEYETDGRSLPQQFFDFIVISHCFFADPQLRSQSNRIYRQIFQRHLKPGGWVLLVVQWTKLYKVYEIERDENVGQEREVIQKFVEEELGLNLQWYRYVTSTGQRTLLKNFREFADRYCPPHTQLDDLYQTYLKLNYRPHYAIDDYIILARSTPQT